MNLRPLLAPAAGVTLLIAAGAVAFATRDTWLPVVFPAASPQPAGGHGHDETGHPDADHGHEQADRVKLSPQAQQNLKLDIGPLTPQPYWRKLVIPGVVVERPGESDRSVPARVGGIVSRIDAKPGNSVSPGQTLFAIEPTGEVVRTQVELATAVAELAILTSNRDVVAAQVKEKTRPANDLIDPQKQVDLAANKVDGLKKQLHALKLTDGQIERAAKGQPVDVVEVVAPEPAYPGVSSGGDPPDFDVHELNVRLGDTVQAGQTLCVLASHNRLLVEGQAFESETAALADLMARRVEVRAEFAGEQRGEWAAPPPPLFIDRLSHAVDPATRTFPFYLSLDNQLRPAVKDAPAHQWRYRPGQRVRLRVPVEQVAKDALVLPAGAVVREGAEAYAFVENGDLFVRRAVTVLHEEGAEVVVANDGSLPAGASVVKNQAAALNRALKAAASEGGGGHHHDHEH